MKRSEELGEILQQAGRVSLPRREDHLPHRTGGLASEGLRIDGFNNVGSSVARIPTIATSEASGIPMPGTRAA